MKKLRGGALVLERAISLLSSNPSSPSLRSLTSILSACVASLRPVLGQSLHACILKVGLPLDPYASSALVRLYSSIGLPNSSLRAFHDSPQRDLPLLNSTITALSNSGDLRSARHLFDEMSHRNVISWTAMVSGYAKSGRYEDAVELFLRMWNEGVGPNEVTLVSVLPAVGAVGGLTLGERIELYARRTGMVEGNVRVGNALVEMFGRCGCLEGARRVFEEMGGRRDLCSWNSMIVGLSMNGRCGEAIRLFNEMKERWFTPNEITFTGVLLACTHGGLVNEGWHYFKSMEKDFSITPNLRHYGCMVDLLGRAGLLNEAYDLIKSMPMEPDKVIWGALLGASSFHGEVELAEIAIDYLRKLEPWNTGNYVTLANIYASVGKWSSVAKVRKVMKGKLHRKDAGYSVIELDGSMSKFIVGDASHPRYRDVCLMLSEIMLAMRGGGGSDSDSDLEIGSFE